MSENMEKPHWNFGDLKKQQNNFLRSFKFLSCSLVLLSLTALFSCATKGAESTKQIIEGNRAALNGNYSASVNNYENALKNVPDAPAAKRNLGIVLVKVGNYRKAKAQLEEILPLYRADNEVAYFLGEACRGLEDYSCAISNYQTVIKRDSKDIRAKKALAWALQKNGDLDKALQIARQIIGQNTSDVQGRLIAATILNKQNQFTKARDILAPIERNQFRLESSDKVSADAEKALIMNAAADTYFGLGLVEKASQLYSQVLKTRPFLASALLGSAKCDAKQGNQDRAVAKLERATKSDPTNKEAYWLSAKLLEQKDAIKSSYYYKRFLILAKDDPTTSEKAQEARRVLKGMSQQ